MLGENMIIEINELIFENHKQFVIITISFS